MKDTRKFYLSGVKECIDEITNDEDPYFKYGVYLATSGDKFDINLFNDKTALLNFLKKRHVLAKPKKKITDW